MTNGDEEKLWSVKVLQYIGGDIFKVTWGEGPITLEPYTNLVGVNEIFI
jgi:hypothetical protein